MECLRNIREYSLARHSYSYIFEWMFMYNAIFERKKL
jgi:hypothetical protein